MSRRGVLAVTLAFLAHGEPVWAHHPGGGGGAEPLGAIGYLFAGVLLALAAIAGWALFGPEAGSDDDDPHPPDR